MNQWRVYCSQWEAMTFLQALEQLPSSSSDLKSLAFELFKELHLLTKKMDGYSVEALPKTTERNHRLPFTYSSVFHRCSQQPFFSPASYLVGILEELIPLELSVSEQIGYLARGLRAFASFLREPDFAWQLNEQLKVFDPTVQTHLNPKQDSAEHTDVLLQFNNQLYRIWLFQASKRAIPHDIERITGQRGELPNGIHLLCPLKTETALRVQKIETKLRRLSDKLPVIQEKQALTKPTTKKYAELQARFEKTSQEMVCCDHELNQLKKQMNLELEVTSGWFFYSPLYVQRTVTALLHQTHFSYSEVRDLLLGPELFLSEIQLFSK